MSTYTLAADGTYTDSRTGGRFKLKAGAVFHNADAVALGLPGATPDAALNPFPTIEADWIDANTGTASALADLTDVDVASAAAGAPLTYDGSLWVAKTIHNYFPDGNIHSNALIDLTNAQDYATKLWYGQAGTEDLTYTAASGDAPGEVSCAIDGWAQGVFAEDWDGRFGADALPAGRYRIGFAVVADGGLNNWVLRCAPYSSVPFAYAPIVLVKLTLDLTRYIMDVYLDGVGPLGVQFVVVAQDQVDDAPTPSGSFSVARVFVTEGDPAKFMDGDSDGWSWTGTHYASPSVGPQP